MVGGGGGGINLPLLVTFNSALPHFFVDFVFNLRILALKNINKNDLLRFVYHGKVLLIYIFTQLFFF